MTQTQLGVVQQAVAALKTKRDLKPWCSAHPELFGQLGFEDLFKRQAKLPIPELQQQIMARISATVSQALSLRDQASASPSGCEI